MDKRFFIMLAYIIAFSLGIILYSPVAHCQDTLGIFSDEATEKERLGIFGDEATKKERLGIFDEEKEPGRAIQPRRANQPRQSISRGCTGSIKVIADSPGHSVKAGDNVKILVQINQNAHLVGRVDLSIGGGQPMAITNSGNGTHVHYWKVPSNLNGDVPIMFSALASQGGDLLCEGRTEITIEEPFRVSLSGPSNLIVGIKETVVAKVTGNTGPYSYKWDISGHPSTSTQSLEKKSIKQVEALPGQSLFRVRVTVKDKEGVERSSQKYFDVVLNTLRLNFLYHPSRNASTDRKVSFELRCNVAPAFSDKMNNIKFEVDWGDNSKKSFKKDYTYEFKPYTKAAFRHAYSKPGKYILRAKATDEYKNGAVISTTINVSPPSPSVANIIMFSGPPILKKGEEGLYKVKIKPGSASLKPYHFKFHWGDGDSVITSTNTSVTQRHIFNQSKVYNVKVTVNDNWQQDKLFIADETGMGVKVMDELPPEVDLRDSGWQHRIDNPSPLEIEIKANPIDIHGDYADIRLIFRNPTRRSMKVTIKEVWMTGQEGIEKKLEKMRCNIKRIFPNETRVDRIRVYVKKDHEGQYHGSLRIKYKALGSADTNFDIYTESTR